MNFIERMLETEFTNVYNQLVELFGDFMDSPSKFLLDIYTLIMKAFLEVIEEITKFFFGNR